jgi:hypothetical protein
LNVVFSEIDSRFHVSDQIDKTLFDWLDLPGERALHLSQSRARLNVGLRFNEITDSFRLDEIHLSIRDGAQSELSWRRQASSRRLNHANDLLEN